MQTKIHRRMRPKIHTPIRTQAHREVEYDKEWYNTRCLLRRFLLAVFLIVVVVVVVVVVATMCCQQCANTSSAIQRQLLGHVCVGLLAAYVVSHLQTRESHFDRYSYLAKALLYSLRQNFVFPKSFQPPFVLIGNYSQLESNSRLSFWRYSKT